MSKVIGTILFILISYLFSPVLFAQQSYSGFPSPFNSRILNNQLHPSYSNPGSRNNFIRLDSITIKSIIVYSYAKLLFQYSSKNLMTEQLYLFYNGSAWENTFKSNYFYDNQDNLLLAVDLVWITNEWDSTYRTEYFYESGNLSRLKMQTYSDSDWINKLHTIFSYTPSGDVEQTLDQVWSGSSWDDLFLTTRYYSGPGKLDSILFQIPAGTGWQNDKKTMFYYAANGIDVDSLIAKIWSNGSWVNLVRRNITNDENHNQVIMVDQDWANNDWINAARLRYDYNSEHYVKSIFGEVWFNNNWVSSDVDMVIQNPDGFIIGFLGANEVHGYYSSIVGVSEEDRQDPVSVRLLQNYPNPFNPVTTIKYSVPKDGNVKLTVYNALGQELAELVNKEIKAGNYEVEFNAKDLASGVYIYCIQAGDFIQTKKMILLK